MGPLSPEGAGRGRGPVVLIMITINSVYFPTLPLLLAQAGQYITRVIPGLMTAMNEKMWHKAK